MKKYRIKEHHGQYTIEVYTEWTEGYLWWKKKVSGWQRATIFGTPNNPFSQFGIVCEPFKSLDAAKEHIKKWKTEPTYHNID